MKKIFQWGLMLLTTTTIMSSVALADPEDPTLPDPIEVRSSDAIGIDSEMPMVVEGGSGGRCGDMRADDGGGCGSSD